MHVLFTSGQNVCFINADQSMATDSKLVHGLIESAKVAVVFGSLHVVLAECSHSKQQ